MAEKQQQKDATAAGSFMPRAKVFHLNEGEWEDCGTGHVTVDCLKGLEEPSLVVIDEEDNETILVHPITSEDMYRKQKESIISWSNPEEELEFSLSFQDTTGCSFIWDEICNIQGGQQLKNDIGAPEASPRPSSGARTSK